MPKLFTRQKECVICGVIINQDPLFRFDAIFCSNVCVQEYEERIDFDLHQQIGRGLDSCYD